MSASISVVELQHQLPGQAQLVDVRSASEFAAGHIPGAMNIPMDQIETRLDDLHPHTPLVLICQAGRRARMTAGLLEPCQRQMSILEGGTSAWIQAGLPVVTNVKTRWSLERQVRLGAGLLVLAGVVLSFTVNGNWLFLFGVRRSGTDLRRAHGHLPDGRSSHQDAVEWAEPVQSGQSQGGTREEPAVSLDTAMPN